MEMVENRFKERFSFIAGHEIAWAKNSQLRWRRWPFNVAWKGAQTVDQCTLSVVSFLYPIYFLISYFRLFLSVSSFLFSLRVFSFLSCLSLSLSSVSLFLSFFLSCGGVPVPYVPGVPALSGTFLLLILLLFYPHVFVCYPYVARMYSYVTRMLPVWQPKKTD